MQSDSLLQESWLIIGVRFEFTLSCQIQAASDDVNTHLLIEGVLAHASITFSAILTSISAIDFYISCISNLLLDITWCKVLYFK
jgi:hypothetical protein